MKNKIIEIKEEVQIGDYVLEKGDKIKILKESFWTKTDDKGYTYLVTVTSDGRDAMPVALSTNLIATMNRGEKESLIRDIEQFVYSV